MFKCKQCGASISNSTGSQLCRKCAQKAAVAKREETCMEKYGVKNVMHKKEFVDKIKDSMMGKYGVKCAMEIPESLEKFKNTCIERYGVPYYVLTKEFVENNTSCISEINKKIGSRLEEVGLSLEYEKVIEDKHYDIYISNSNILIEVDPTYTHNAIGNHWDNNGISKDYHKMKTAIGVTNGYRVIHIYDWDDVNKIVQMLKHKNKIYARQCQVKEVDKSTYKKFTNEYHLQGLTKNIEFCLGLYFNDELVEIMAWGRPRFNKHYQYELLRLCTRFGYCVVGGSEKLFKHSLDRIGNASIISYCDLSKFTGDVYKRLGMKLLRINQPQEVWSKGNERVLSTTLRQLGYDKLFDADYGKGTSNEELMIKHGWLPVYDCGQAVYVYNCNANVFETETESDCSDIKEYQKIAEQVKQSKIKIKQCAFCGKDFIQRSHSQIYCKEPHIRICPVCGKEYEEKNHDNLKKPPHACSYACRAAKTKQTSLERYGCLAPGNNPEAREKAKSTMQKKYGADYTMQSTELAARARKTLLERYGVENPNQIKSAKEKRKQTFQLQNDTLIFYQEPRVNKIQASDLQVYKLDVEYANQWLNEYHPFKSPRGAVLALGLCDESQTYCIMTFKKSRNKNYVAELSRLWMLPTYDVVDGYQVLSQYASELGLYNIVAYVNLSFENVDDYKSIGMKYLRTNQRTKWWYKNNEIVADASRRQSGLSHNDMVFKGYKFAYDLGVAVYTYA